MLRLERLYWSLITILLVGMGSLFVAKAVLSPKIYQLVCAGFENLLFFTALLFLVTAMYMLGLNEHERKEQKGEAKGLSS